MTKSNRTEKQNEVFVCRHCGNKTSHRLICRHSVPVPLGVYDSNYKEINADDYFFLFECGTCRGICLKNVFSENIDPDPRSGMSFEDINCLYPVSMKIDEVPKGLESVIAEANRVKHVSFLGYLILVRKVLEEVCKDRKANGKNLKEKLNSLVNKEKLPTIFLEASEKLRLLGNISAHESSLNISKKDVQLVEDFLVAFLAYIYIMPSKLKKLNQTLDKQSST